ncbi:MAG: hypothetical protein R3B74_00595 [Nitrospirales bacterium]|nr:hypothetical protein [Nitrospirales bacterium]
MVKIWCSISSHGYGHAAQVIPILNELGQRIPDAEVILRTTVPREFFEHKLHGNWVIQEKQQDIGCLQQGPLEIDIDGTWKAYQHFHQGWADNVKKEAEAIRDNEIDLVISNISHFGIAAGIEAGLPTVAIASLSWDQILLNLRPLHARWQQDILREIQEAYGQASHLIRLFPGIDMPAFPRSSNVGPSFLSLPTKTSDIRTILSLSPDDRLVLVAFGGVPFGHLPLNALQALEGFHFIVSGVPVPDAFTRISCWESLNVPFLEALSQSDLVMTKPGYSTIVTAIHYGTPIIYVRRDNFVEEANLVDYAHQYGRAYELSREDFQSGSWEHALMRVMEHPLPRLSPPQNGAKKATDILKTFLNK